jgi:hypothetical protein
LQNHADEEERVKPRQELLDVCASAGAEWGERERYAVEVWDVYLVLGLDREKGG